MPQGSQVFAREQARALARVGAEVTLVCYGRGAGAPPADLEIVRVPRVLSPRASGAGPRLAKPLADAALVAALVRASRQRRFEAVLAHNVEAALVGIAARTITGVPVVYVVHTLFEDELRHYGPDLLGGALARAGRRLDVLAAARSDAVLALCEAGAERLRPGARGPVAVIPPGHLEAPAPDLAAVARAAGRAGLEPGSYALYAGNLDGYQDLEDLAAAADQLPELPIVAATHDRRPRALGALRIVPVESAEELRSLLFGAVVTVLPRRRVTGFPIKVLNYMEAARPIVARSGVIDGLVHGRDAWLVAADGGPAAFAAAIRALLADPVRALRLGAAARTRLREHHAWPVLAERTLALCERARASST